MGLYSLYSELHPNWLSSSGCILRYPVSALAELGTNDDVSVETQLSVLMEVGLPWLESICTQQKLIDAVCDFETRQYGKIQWVDSFKLAPYLLSGDYLSADRVITSILQQHVGPHYWTTKQWTSEDYEIYKHRYPGRDTKLLEIHKWIVEDCSTAIDEYLRTNYVANGHELTKKSLL